MYYLRILSILDENAHLSSLSHLPSISMTDGSWKPPRQGGGCAHDADTGVAMTHGSSGCGGTQASSLEAG
jgi:hypothetical protein